jgi:uncharacterized protein YbjT (DUF2867 family)
MSELVLTYGAGGAQGAPVARELLAQGYRVRALVRDPARSGALAAAGAEIVPGDLADLESLRRASQGAGKVFLMLPFSGGGNPLEYAQNAVQAASEAGVSLIVLNTSGQTPRAPSGFPMLDYRIHLEALLRGSGVPSVILRPTAYMENFLGPWVLPRLHAENVVAYPVGAERPTSWIAAADLGRLVVAALGRLDLAGQAFDVGGPEALTGADIARSFSRGLGREVRYEPISPEDFGAIMGQVMGPEAQAGIVAAYRAGEAAPLDAMVVEMRSVLATLPIQQTTLEEWVRTHAEVLSAPQVGA